MVAKKVQSLYSELGDSAEIIDLRDLGLGELDGSQYGKDKPAALQKACDDLLQCQSMTFVVPEYNGSFPGALKYFIDQWPYPDTFEFRPACFIGLGGRFGGLRPVEHLQQVMGYRNAFLYPKRVFLHNVWSLIDKQGQFLEEDSVNRLKAQAEGFLKFVNALEAAGLEANTFLKEKT
jgi:NAD(P)H-dependent FMN reductase